MDGNPVQRLQAGFTLGGRYVLRACVGAGGMGEVWAANDTMLARTVALKIMHPRTDDELVFAARFREEAMHTAVLSHLNIATLFDYGEDDGLAYLVMELVRGVTLQQLLNDDGAQPPSRVRSVIGQAALALSVAHEAGIVHRDVKPANIMVTKDGTVKLTDFGIARSADSAGLTRHGELLGTPHYVSPEQALGESSRSWSTGWFSSFPLICGWRPLSLGGQREGQHGRSTCPSEQTGGDRHRPAGVNLVVDEQHHVPGDRRGHARWHGETLPHVGNPEGAVDLVVQRAR